MNNKKYKFYEFFAGGGMARAGLGNDWECIFANDFDDKKGNAYIANWGESDFLLEDVAKITTADLPNEADLAWASFPCQDLSLAGNGGGIHAKRSGTFWSFWSLIKKLKNESRAPKFIILENVYGAITSHEGKDFSAIANAVAEAGYLFGAVVIDAKLFLPQSRPRLFIICIRPDISVPDWLASSAPSKQWHPDSLLSVHEKLKPEVKSHWLWWHLDNPPVRSKNFIDIIEESPKGVKWHTTEQTNKILSMMSDVNLKKVEVAKVSGNRMVGAIYRRTRNNIQRAEVRFDDIAGCLRTPSGGSSRQSIMVVEKNSIRTRLLSTREAARLMGLPEDYLLPPNYNAAYHLVGDGVAVPVVKFISEQILTSILEAPSVKRVAA